MARRVDTARPEVGMIAALVERLVEICTAHKAELEAEEGTKNDGAAEE